MKIIIIFFLSEPEDGPDEGPKDDQDHGPEPWLPAQTPWSRVLRPPRCQPRLGPASISLSEDDHSGDGLEDNDELKAATFKFF